MPTARETIVPQDYPGCNMSNVLNFNYSNRNGVGFLITYGGIAQFSIAWDEDSEPQRMTVSDAHNVDLKINGVPVSGYDIVCDGNTSTMALKEVAPAPAPTPDPAPEGDAPTGTDGV